MACLPSRVGEPVSWGNGVLQRGVELAELGDLQLSLTCLQAADGLESSRHACRCVGVQREGLKTGVETDLSWR